MTKDEWQAMKELSSKYLNLIAENSKLKRENMTLQHEKLALEIQLNNYKYSFRYSKN